MERHKSGKRGVGCPSCQPFAIEYLFALPTGFMSGVAQLKNYYAYAALSGEGKGQKKNMEEK